VENKTHTMFVDYHQNKIRRISPYLTISYNTAYLSRWLVLRPVGTNRLVKPHCMLSTIGSRAFAVSVPTIWKSLSAMSSQRHLILSSLQATGSLRHAREWIRLSFWHHLNQRFTTNRQAATKYYLLTYLLTYLKKTVTTLGGHVSHGG